MYKRVKKFIISNEMIVENDIVFAGVSGGADSTAMLCMLKEYQKECAFELVAIHVHHGIRGDEADYDALETKHLCEKLGIACHLHYYNVPKLSEEWKMGHEEAGRIVRKDAFNKEAKEIQNRNVKIALAHNKNDLAETMLHNLARGSGLRGLSSMRPISENIIRPVLCLERDEIEEYLKRTGIAYVTDSSNLFDEYTRNRIRHRVLPEMKKSVNANVINHMAKTAEFLTEADEYLMMEATRMLKQCTITEEKAVLGTEMFTLPVIMKKYILQMMLEKLSGKRKDFTADHIESLLKLMDMQTGKSISLPYHLVGCKTYEGICIHLPMQNDRQEDTPKKLRIPGATKWNSGEIQAEIFHYKEHKISEKKYTKWFDYDKIKMELCVRTRQSGDYMTIDQKGSHKLLKRIMIDDKISREIRNQIPVIACDKEIVWIVGGRINEKYKISDKTTRILELKYEGGKIHA